MKCKTCGATLDEYDDTCPFCGTPVDDQFEAQLFEEEAAEKEEPVEEEKPRISSLAEKYMKKSSPSFSLPKLSEKNITTGAIGLAVLLSIISLIVAGGAVRKANAKVKELNSELFAMQTSVDAAYSKASALEGMVYDLQSKASSSTAPQPGADTTGEITKAPSDEYAAINRENVWIFSVEVRSGDNSFVWQKYNDSTGEWVNVPISTADDGYAATWEKKDDGNGVRAKLVANKITNASFGKYRCMITTKAGSVILTPEATLAQA